MTKQTSRARFAKTSAYEDLVFVAGSTPRRDGVMVYTGVIGRDLTLDEASDAAQLAVQNALIEAEVFAASNGVRLAACHRMTVYSVVAETAAITQVADAASDQLAIALGRDGVGVRTAIGVAGLPGNAPVEVELTLSVAP